MFVQPFNLLIGDEFDRQGVYAIRHEPSGRCYVGSSASIRTRLNQHKNQLAHGKHHSSYLQNTWDKYKNSEFTAVLLEEVSVRDELPEREQAWIDKLDSFHNGFNARPKAENFYGMEWSEEQNASRQKSNKKTWSQPELREKLSKKFKGKRRGKWTQDSHERASESLKKRHMEDPGWRRKTREILDRPENEAKRVAGVRRSLKDPAVLEARITQLSEACQSPKRIKELRKAYFEKFDRATIGVKSPEELDALCRELYEDGNSLRDIGRLIGMDHKSVSQRLKRLKVEIKRMPKKGSKLKASKLKESDVREIKKLLKEGVSQAKIAKKFCVSNSVISEINTGKAWKHVVD